MFGEPVHTDPTTLFGLRMASKLSRLAVRLRINSMPEYIATSQKPLIYMRPNHVWDLKWDQSVNVKINNQIHTFSINKIK